MVNEGKYFARVCGAGLYVPNSNVPMARIDFEFTAEGKTEKLAWFGSFGEKSQEKTIETLIKAGFKGVDAAELIEGTKMFEPKDLEIVVTHDEYNGKKRAQVRWVNIPGGTTFEGLTKTEAVKITSGLNLKAGFAAARAKVANAKPAATTTGNFNTEDVPF